MKVAQHFSAGFMLEKTRPSRQGRLKESVSARSLVDGNSIVPAGTDALRNAHPALKCWAIFITSLSGRFFFPRRGSADRYVDAHARPWCWATFIRSLPPAPRRRFAMARPCSLRARRARRAKVACGLRRTGRDWRVSHSAFRIPYSLHLLSAIG